MTRSIRFLFCAVAVMCSPCQAEWQGNNAYFLPTLKPMHCHDIQIHHVRSVVKCALHCQANCYSCLGFSVTTFIPFGYECHVCFIFDTKTRMTIAPIPSNNVASFMPMCSQHGGESTYHPWDMNFFFMELVFRIFKSPLSLIFFSA